MQILNIKLWREFLHMRAQVVAIAFVIVGGVSTFVMAVSALDSLRETRDEYYRQYRYADIFVRLGRAPEQVARRLREIPGVRAVETRIVAPVSMDIRGFDEPVTGLVVSLPDRGRARVNDLYLRAGRRVAPGRNGEVVISSTLARAHRLRPGDHIRVTIHGKRRRLRIVGVALSPEFIYQVRAGAMFPDEKRYGILWMSRKALGRALDMQAAFNDAVFLVHRQVNVREIITRIDLVLDRYGGLGAYARKDHASDRFLATEMAELRTMATVFPVIFLSLAVFMLNISIGRIVILQRELIGVLKANGYDNFSIGWHYSKLMLMIATLGVIGGLALGAWFGHGLSRLYMTFFHFPFLDYRLHGYVIVIVALAAWIAALLGTLHAVRRAALLPPAEAMRPEPPPRYRIGRLERLIAGSASPVTRMILRHIGRHPFKSALTVAGIAFATGIVMLSSFQRNAIDYMIDLHYRISQQDDMKVTFIEPTQRRSLYSLYGIDGVHYGEPFRVVPVRLRHAHYQYRTVIEGLPRDSRLRRILDHRLQRIDLPRKGILMTDFLAQILHLRPGQMVTVEILEGERPVRRLPLVGLVRQPIGLSAYMEIGALNRFMREGPLVSGVYLLSDRHRNLAIFRDLRDMPRVAGTVQRQTEIVNMRIIMDRLIVFFTMVTLILGIGVTFGVIYNSARIALSERGRELASMRVLGFTRREITWLLLGEFGILTLLAIPLGFVFGYGFCRIMTYNLQTELFRVPLILRDDSYAFAALVVVTGALFSAWLIARKLKHLDLIGVLKTRE